MPPALDVDGFHERGFTVPVDSGNDRQLTADLAERCSRVAVERHKHPIYGRYALRDWHLLDDDLRALLTAPPIIKSAAQILGEDLLLWRSKIFYKPPGGDPTGWHQEWGAFDGEEIGNSVPSLVPAEPSGGIWDVTVWIALDDVGPDNSPLQFVAGSNHRRVPWRMVSMNESAFFEDPFVGLDRDEIVQRTVHNELILDIRTDHWLTGTDVGALDRDTLVTHLRSRVEELQAKFTDFSPDPSSVTTVTTPAGHFVVFSERTMHGAPANNSGRRRVAVNARITKASTLVYPGRLKGQFIDGSNLDIRDHTSLLVSGRALEPRNVVV